MPFITRDLVDSLDILCVLPLKPSPEIDKVLDKISGKIYSGKELDQIRLFAAVLGSNPRYGSYPSPVLSIGEPETIEEKEKRRIVGLHPSEDVERKILELEKSWGSEVVVDKKGIPYVFVGCGTYLDAIVFPEPVQFDPKKRLFFVRSPNGEYPIENVLGTAQFSENIFMGLTHHQVKDENYGAVLENIDGVNYLLISDEDGRQHYVVEDAALGSLNLATIRNKTCNFPSVDLEEARRKGPQQKYSLVYVNLDGLKRDCRWAAVYDDGEIKFSANRHLETRPLSFLEKT